MNIDYSRKVINRFFFPVKWKKNILHFLRKYKFISHSWIQDNTEAKDVVLDLFTIKRSQINNKEI